MYEEDLFNDCPCKICIVGAICKIACHKETIWYRKLSREDKSIYLNLDCYKFYRGFIKLNLIS